MCGRYTLEWAPDEVSERFQLRRIPTALFEGFASYNAAPTQELPVILVDDQGERVIRRLRWGLIPRWAKPGEHKGPAPFNARAETLLEKAMFKNLVGKRRCLVPINGYYEWREEGGRKQPYLLTVPDEPLVALGGLWDELRDEENVDGDPAGSFTVVTTTPSDFASAFHHRMPLVLPRDDEGEWLDPTQTDPVAVMAMAQPYPGEMTARPVSRALNNVRVNDRSLLDAPPDEPPSAPAPVEAESETRSEADSEEQLKLL